MAGSPGSSGTGAFAFLGVHVIRAPLALPWVFCIWSHSTIESVAAVDADHVVVANDNNLPFSAGRHLGRADDNEFILLRVPELLRAR